MKRRYTFGEFNESFPPLMDGVGNVVKNYTAWLRRQGHDAYAIVSGTEGAAEFDAENGVDYTVRCFLKPVKKLEPYGTVVFTKEFKKRIASIPFDLVHAHEPMFMGKLALKIARRRNIPVVTTFHSQIRDDIYGYTHMKWLTNLALKCIMRFYDRMDEVWVPSEATVAVLRDYGYKGPVVVMNNGCDMTSPVDEAEYEALRRAGREAYNPERKRQFLYIGQQRVEKNIMLILEALAAMKKEKRDFKVLMVGDGPDRKQFERFVADHGLQDDVVFLGRITDRTVLRSIYCSTDVMLFPSFYDTSSLVIREAAAFSLPMAGISGACTAELIVPDENGYLAGENTAASYRELLERLLVEDEKSLKRVGLQAHDTLYQSWDDVVGNVFARYEALIEKKRTSQGT